MNHSRRPAPLSGIVTAIGLSMGMTDLDDLEAIWHEMESRPVGSGPKEIVSQFQAAALRLGIVLPDLTANLTAKVTPDMKGHALASYFSFTLPTPPKTAHD